MLLLLLMVMMMMKDDDGDDETISGYSTLINVLYIANYVLDLHKL